jgi:hypothetical protein
VTSFILGDGTDTRIGKVYTIIDTARPPNIIGVARLEEKIGPGHFKALTIGTDPKQIEVYSCQLFGEVKYEAPAPKSE